MVIHPIVDPFPNVAGHVPRAVGAGAGRVAAHAVGVAHAIYLRLVVVVQPRAVGRLVAPGVHAVAAAAGGLFPLGLGGQPLAGPGAIVGGVIPGDLDDRESAYRGLS